MSYLDKFRERFKLFKGEPWFEPTVVAFDHAFEQDDEYLEEEIVKGLIETAVQRGITIPYLCGECEEEASELEADGETCALCECADILQGKRNLKAAFDEEQRRALLTPEQRAAEDANGQKTIRLMLGGLMARDVQ